MIETVTIKDAADAAQPIAADKIGSDYYQVVKLAYGADGVLQLVDAAGLPVVIVGTVPVSGPLTDAQLRATPVPVNGTVAVTGTFWQATQPVSAASLPLPTGAATQATLASIDADVGALADAAATTDTGSFSLLAFIKRGLQNWTTLLGRVPAQGQGTMAASLPVAIASNQSAVAVSGTFWQATQPVSIASWAGLTDAQLRAAAVPVSLASTTVTGSVAVTGTFWQATQPVSAASLPLPTGAASETTLAALNTKIPASPATEGGNLATLVARTPALGAATAAGAIPVTVSVETASGNITTQNLVPNGAATANSAVELTLNGAMNVAIQVTGTYTGALSLQVTNDNARWETVTAAWFVNAITGAGTATITSAAIGVFGAPVRGFLKCRITGLAAMTGTATVTLRAAPHPATITVVQPTAANLNATVSGTVTANIGTGALAAGTNAIGDTGIQYRANATGAASISNMASPLVPAGTSIKASAGRLLTLSLANTSAGVRWLKIFNATAVTMGTTSAVIDRPIPAGGTLEFELDGGLGFATGIMWAVTSARGQTDNTATGLALGDVCGFAAFA